MKPDIPSTDPMRAVAWHIGIWRGSFSGIGTFLLCLATTFAEETPPRLEIEGFADGQLQLRINDFLSICRSAAYQGRIRGSFNPSAASPVEENLKANQ